jgi:glyoxylase-like metal-dependent hydrolase (beta-lactamase superfamily II)
MDSRYYRFNVGLFECVAISDGNLNYSVQSFFANAPLKQVQAALCEHGFPSTQITSPYTCLFINTGHHQVLIDTGAGNLGASAATIFPNLDHATSVTGTLVANMRAAGVEPDDVSSVIITHAHPDHIGGTLDQEGRLVFANAHYFISALEWDYWTSDAAAGSAIPMAQLIRRNLEAVRARVTLIADGSEIVSGIHAIATPGHTIGHLAVSVASAEKYLLHVSDAALNPLHLEYPAWMPIFDVAPEQAVISKQRIFDHAAEQQALVFAHHFPPFPNLGYVVKQTEGWQWQPLDTKE